MCRFCERKPSPGWDQPPLEGVSGNIIDGTSEAVIYDYQTASPELAVRLPAVGQALWGDGIAMVYIPVRFCPVCGRKLGKAEGTVPHAKRDVIYVRVPASEPDADGEMRRQAEQVAVSVSYLQNPVVLRETGDGHDDNREGIQELIRMVLDDEVNNVYVACKSILACEGYHYLESMFRQRGVPVIPIRGEREDDVNVDGGSA